LTDREMRFDKHIKSVKYKNNMRSHQYVNELGDSEDEEVKNANLNGSIGSSVSSGGLLEKDMTNLMN
jgi:hypothetical protein